MRAALLLVLIPLAANGQGGPPLLSDDPGTPGPRRWEVNVAYTLDQSPGVRVTGTPLVDANYGWGERVQLKLEVPWVVRSEDGGPDRTGLGNPILGIKWRFLDEESEGVAVSAYPQLELNVAGGSADEGLVERRAQFLLPLSAAKRLGPVEVNGEVGGLFQEGEPPRWVWGLVLGYEFPGGFQALAELFGVASANAAARQTLLELGVRWRAGSSATILFAAGRSLEDGDGEGRHTRLYAGVQLTLGPRSGSPP